MKRLGILLFLFVSFCCAQDSDSFQPSETNVWGSEYPRVDSTGRVQIRIKAPDATKVKVNFWSGPKVDMVKQPDGFWTVTTDSTGAWFPLLQLEHRWRRSQRSRHACLLRRRSAC